MEKREKARKLGETPAPMALDPSEITVAMPEAAFDPLPKDYAPTRSIPEADPSSHPPEYRTSEETATQAIPVQGLNPLVADEIRTDHPSDSELGKAGVVPGNNPGSPTRRKSSAGLWLGLGACALLVAGAAVWFLWSPLRSGIRASVARPSIQVAPEAVPPELRAYMDQAKAGDAKAMHMIALMYWNGLNVRQDRAKGLEWYRKAAAAGSTAAQKFLSDNGVK